MRSNHERFHNRVLPDEYLPLGVSEVNAIESIRDGVAFTVIAGTEVARPVYSDGGALAIASEDTRAAAKRARRNLRAGGVGGMAKSARSLPARVIGTRISRSVNTNSSPDAQVHAQRDRSELQGPAVVRELEERRESL